MSTATIGLDNGMTMLHQEPQIAAAVHLARFEQFIRNGRLEERPGDDDLPYPNRVRNEQRQSRSISPSSLTTMYVGINPPLKIIVNVISIMSTLRPKNVLRESGYAIMIVSVTLISVPAVV